MRTHHTLHLCVLSFFVLGICGAGRADEPLPPGLPTLGQSSVCAALPETAGGPITEDSHAIGSAIVPALTGSATKPQTIDKRLKQLKLAGVSVAVIRGGKLTWARGWGLRDSATCQPVTAETLFQAASISKTLTAVLALRQVEQGHIALDANINRALTRWQLPADKRFTPNWVNLRQILSHTAGLSTSGFSGYAPGMPLPSLLDTLDGKTPANSPAVRLQTNPGGPFDYSGGGYMIVMTALEDITHQPFAELAAKDILRPLGMTHSSFTQPPSPSMLGNIASGHHLGRPFVDKYYVYPELAAAGLWTTPSDLTRFLIDIRAGAASHGHLLTPQITAEMLKPGSRDWGLGFAFFGEAPDKVFGHYGGNWGFLSWMWIDPKTGDGIVVMSNGERGITMAQDIVRATANHYGWNNFRSRSLLDAVETTPLFIRGSMNEWSTKAPLQSKNHGAWQADITLQPGNYEFNIGSADGKISLGSDIGASTDASAQALALVAGGDNLRLHVTKPGTYRFTFQADETGVARLLVVALDG